MAHEETVLELAHELGFDLAGIAPLEPPPAAAHFDAWLAAGRHGSMEYLARNRDRITDPRRIRTDGRSLLVVGLGHSRAAFELPGGGRVARYAAGRDYHNLIGKRLRRLARRLVDAGVASSARAIVDAGPLLERSHAAVAGLGFESKAANLLHPDFGPWFFLGELVLDVDLAPTEAPFFGSCGTCTACIDACPTGAIREPGVVHSPDCISYQTIEHRGPIPDPLRSQLGDWAFGCDVCSEVCPWGSDAPDLAERYGVHRALADSGLVSWIDSAEPFEGRFEGSPVRRPRREGVARNAAIVLGNRPSDEGHRALLRALSFDPSELVRDAAAWALGQGYGESAETRTVLDDALGREASPLVRRSIEKGLGRAR